MAKGGTKRKLPMEKITTKASLQTCHTKRSHGLFSKASQLCLLSDAQIAILATPSSTNSNVSFYSFGHSSVDSVVSAFLSGKRPVPAPIPSENKKMREDLGICLASKELGLGFWWNDERLAKSENRDEIKEAVESMSSLLKRLRSEHANQRDHHQAFVNDDVLKNNGMHNKKSDVVLYHETDQTLNLQSTSAICCIPDYLQNNNIRTQEPDDCLKKDTEIVVIGDDKQQDQILSTCENSCKNKALLLPAEKLDDEEMDLDQLIDYETKFEDSLSDDEYFNIQELEEYIDSLPMSSTEAVEDVSTEKKYPNLQSNCRTSDDLPESCNGFVVKNSEEQDQVMAVPENFCNNNALLPAGYMDEFNNQEMELDFGRPFESIQEFDDFVGSLLLDDNSADPNLLCDFEAVGNRGLNEDDLHFSDVFEGLC